MKAGPAARFVQKLGLGALRADGRVRAGERETGAPHGMRFGARSAAGALLRLAPQLRAHRLPRPLRAVGRALRRGTMLCGAPVLLAAISVTGAQAQDAGGPMRPETVLNLALIGLTIGAAMIAAVWLIRQQAATAEENKRLRADLADALNEADRRGTLLAEDNQRLLVFSGPGAPDLVGTLPKRFGAPPETAAFLDFEGWMTPDEARELTRALSQLRNRAEGFRMEVESAGGHVLEIVGRTAGALAVVRFTPLSGLREEIATLRLEQNRANGMIETMQALFDAAPLPMWLRGEDERLVWVNDAYAKAVDAPGVISAVDAQTEFLNEQDRAQIIAARAQNSRFQNRLSAVVDADRRNFLVVDAAGPFGSAGVAIDISETESVRRELRETVRSHSETLDHLTTAVARFDDKTQLAYHNAAFAKLFGLSAAYLDKAPDLVSILDHLRSRGVLPDDRPLRDVKVEIQAAHRATEPTDALWHLTDGRTLRVFTSPEPSGGASWVFEDLTEKLQLESRLNALVRLQGETLDYLREGVAVFGQDGRLRLSNPIFAELWGLSDEFLAAKPHIRAFAGTATVSIRRPADGSEPQASWAGFSHAVTAFDEAPREAQGGEFELSDGRVQAYGIVPLPNGQTMLTFSDITDARQAERMLRERNEALEHAARLKSDFVQHVNYELRSPLTNIIGFSALLRSAETGPLNTRQSEYLDYIGTSTSTLLTIVNDILDLATIDAGIMDLDLGEVDIAYTVDHAAEAVRERLRDNEIRLDIDIAQAGTSFRADGHRVTQVLFNLLSNAANFAPQGSAIQLSARRRGDSLFFAVADEGPGISPANVERVFERFETDPAGGRQSGAGLGLSIVKSFVELHGGDVSVTSGPKGGAVVTCRFPLMRQERDLAAE
ncbi:sensor histidine kinase [Aureimonas sp. AU40]|uniref:sensor histidine kinase n=1 Tax=Aureimonas sp. AU40 TaxID=1637747 RepID=UPI001FCDC265|nr:PAS domain-containing sensor histidine kinase [Aureimonas sp. AU40]